MAENFDLIFGQNASQQYAWSDNDYQNGWETIGNIPPTAAQFDALQRRSDTKMKELNDELAPLVNADTADSRQPSTTYSEGDIKYSPLLPTGWFLTCTVAGITSASEIVLPTPIAEKDTVTDGTVTWEINKIGTGSGGDGFAVGDIIMIAGNNTIRDGWLECDGRAVSRAMFPDLFSAIGTTYGAGDGSTTFNLPNADFIKASQSKVIGVYGNGKTLGLTDGNSNGGLTTANDTVSSKLALVFTNSAYGTSAGQGQGSAGTSARTSKSIGVVTDGDSGLKTTIPASEIDNNIRYIIKAYDGVTPTPAEADISEMLTELTGKADRDLDNLSADGEDHFLERDFTIIYPNGGTEASPANITVDSRYVEANPFPGYYVNCVVEVFYENEWGNPNWANRTNGDTDYGCGAKASQLGDNIIIKTGDHSNILNRVGVQGSPYTNTTGVNPPLPCRVKVWKIGKIPT